MPERPNGAVSKAVASVPQVLNPQDVEHTAALPHSSSDSTGENSDFHLDAVIRAWPDLPEAVKVGIAAMATAARLVVKTSPGRSGI
jgi:hypothetical protein